jgi:hypothetical protein
MHDTPKCPDHGAFMMDFITASNDKDCFRCPIASCEIRWSPKRLFYRDLAPDFPSVPSIGNDWPLGT